MPILNNLVVIIKARFQLPVLVNDCSHGYSCELMQFPKVKQGSQRTKVSLGHERFLIDLNNQLQFTMIGGTHVEQD